WLIENTSDQITIIDAAGRQVTIQKPIKRIVYNHVNAAEAINILGAWNMVVGGMIGSISPKLFPGIEEMPNCIASGNPFDIDYESVFELQPDIFLTLQSMIPGYNDIVEKLEPSIPVVALVNTADPDSFDTSVRMLGAILDEQEKAEEYISWCNSIKNEIGSRIENLSETDQPRVFLKSPGWTADQLCTLTNELLFCNSLFNAAGGINIANVLPSNGGWVENVDPEWIVAQDYDIIVIQIWVGLYPGALGYEVNDDSIIRDIREDIMASELFAGSRAIKNNKVYLHHSDLATTHRYIVGIAYWAKWFHPELFKELDPQAIHQEYLRKFMHVDLDLDSGGIIAYPED
ncbi:MAG: ABC transporter substrate-binding protein, partial [Desulfobacterales bacterium]|nr:ABC transporter substrate-binding protein [Desulfobacterales bacterium]